MVIFMDQEEKQRVIVTDEVLGRQKIVLKEFELAAFRRLKLFQDLCLTGDGRAVLVLDADPLSN